MLYITFQGPTRFKSTSIKPYFWPKNTYNTKPDKLEATAKLDKLKAPNKLAKIEASLPTLEASQKLTKPTKPTVKRGQGRP